MGWIAHNQALNHPALTSGGKRNVPSILAGFQSCFGSFFNGSIRRKVRKVKSEMMNATS
ncbi:hypothetical protein J2X72_004334 [Phyllobacterium sp. 1468]|nr:hypothetical protein [Phyllobacterium sp. 1468]